MRVDAAFGEAELPLPDLIEKEPTDRILASYAGLIVGNGVRGKQVREVVPQADLDVVSVGILQPIDGASRLHSVKVDS